MTQQHALTWGALDFVSETPTDDGWLLEAVADGTNFGNPKAVIEIVRSLLTDGSLAVLEGWDNREVSIRVRISSPEALGGPGLAAAEAAIMDEIRSPAKAPMIWVPPATDAATCVFDVVAATLDRDTGNKWDEEEVLREYRYYLLTLTCLPFVRGEATTVVPALGPPPDPGTPPVVVDIDTCVSFAGWAASYTNLTSTSSGSAGGYVFGQGNKAAAGSQTVTLTRTGAVSMGTTPLLRVEMEFLGPAGAGSIPGIRFDGGAVTAPTTQVGNSYYFTPPASFSSMAIVGGSDSNAGGLYALRVHNVARTDGIGTVSGTTRQQARTTTVSGSAPTTAAIRLFDATPGVLGTEILVHSSRNTAWQCALRPFRTSSAAVTADTAMISGGRNTLTSAMVFRVAANKFTEGTYSLMARMSVSTGGTLGWSARTVSSAGATTIGSGVTVSGSVTVPVTSGYQVLNLAAIPLPILEVAGDQMIELTLTGTANMTVDEAWLFGIHDGALTWIRDTDSMTWIEIQSPELSAARPAIFGGTGAFGTNGIDVSWKAAGATWGSFGTHRFEPGLMQIFTVTSSSLVSQSEIEFYERAHSHMVAAA